MITVSCVYYKNTTGQPYWAGCYSPEWVDKLCRGVMRNYSKPFKFVCFTNEDWLSFKEEITLVSLVPGSWHTICKQQHALDCDNLVILGLDTIITGKLDEIFAFEGALAVPRDPYMPDQPCNGVVIQRGARPDIASATAGSDMMVIRQFPHQYLDDLFPGQVLSYKVHVKLNGLGDARLVYFHGVPKPSDLQDDWVKEHWV